MKIAPLHPREPERLEALEALDILDSMPEQDFDEITLLASQICETPIALVSLVAEQKQWFKSKVGLTTTETPRKVSFCAHAILQDEVTVVQDAPKDERFHENPLTTGDTPIRFYAGARLLSPQGLPIGTVCVMDTQPRENGLSARQAWALKALSNQATRLLDLRAQVKILKESEARLTEASRLSALGLMAVGIAHEINNPLSIITGRASLLRSKITSNSIGTEAILKDLETINLTAHRIAKIVKGLRMYSRKAENDPTEPVSFSSILEDTLNLCSDRVKGHGIELQVTGDQAMTLDCRPSEVAQILMNLIGNSFDAVHAQSEKWIRIHVELKGKDLQVSVSDSGPGISAEVAKKLMHPFFTTKELGNGTGLGLAISLGIAKAHGGHLAYDSAQKNTTFVLTLPCHSFRQA
jgi:two-component system NtrC family sensor kinase